VFRMAHLPGRPCGTPLRFSNLSFFVLLFVQVAKASKSNLLFRVLICLLRGAHGTFNSKGTGQNISFNMAKIQGGP